MPVIPKTATLQAVKNVSTRGDTDIFPFPFDNHALHDKHEEVGALLSAMSGRFDESLADVEILHHSTLAPVGYTGFRWATQLDPLWNAYLLSAVLTIAQDLESKRVGISERTVFSYRYSDGEENLFGNGGWREFQERSRELARTWDYVVVSDIADFYPRIYHHRLENALGESTKNSDVVQHIRRILGEISGGASYGLPVGGPAARMLSEITINQVDRLMLSSRLEFEYCRFADDYRIFVKDRTAAYEVIGYISDKLHANLGLSLQKSKTLVMSSDEYLSMLEPEDPPEGSPAQFLRLHLHFDPYSESPDEDYERLRDELAHFDILGLLRAELLKSQVHPALTRKLARAVTYLPEEERAHALRSFVDERNLEKLAPVMPQILMTLRNCLPGMGEELRQEVEGDLLRLLQKEHFLTKIELNLQYMVRALAGSADPSVEGVLVSLYDQAHGFRSSPSPNLQRDIMVAMARREASHWVRDSRSRYAEMHPWVKRAFMVASFGIGDEGAHWRRSRRKSASSYDQLLMDWAAEKKQGDAEWRVPL